jgi:phospholipase C
MKYPKRREFLIRTAGALSAAASLSPIPAIIKRALAAEPARVSGTLQDVKHVVILMQENRSFDHYFGTLRGVRGFGDRFPIPLPSGKPVWYQSDGQVEIPPYHLDSKSTSALLVPDTPHSFADSQAAWGQGRFGEWPRYKSRFSMGHYRREDIPFQFALAEAFTICDSYHCSLTTGTDPNRIVFWSGSNYDPTLGRRGINCTVADAEPNNLRCWISGVMPTPGYTFRGSAFNWPTLPELLQDAGISWRIYQDPNDNWTGAMHGCLAFDSFRKATAQSNSPLYENGMKHWSIEDLRSDVINGTLPAVSWILPTTLESEHPAAGSSPHRGADFTARIIDALTASRDSWSKTVLFVTFDENDGFFDHVPAPAVPSFDTDGTPAGGSTVSVAGEYFSDPEGHCRIPDDTISGALRPWGLGARVPMYVVSPWTKGGWVTSQVFDHTSMGMFLERRFGISVPSISPWHRAVCGDLTSVFDFSNRGSTSMGPLPDMTEYAQVESRQRTLPEPAPPELPAPLFQESGFRPSRALPYELHTSARLNSPGSVELIFSNTGKQGAVFHVYDRLHLDRIPRRYTVESGKSLQDRWNPDPLDAGAYDLWVYSTNGFLRTFKGNASMATDPFQPEIQICYQPRARRIHLKVRNGGSVAGLVNVRSNAYRSDGPWVLSVSAAKTVSLAWTVDGSGNWYDFTASSNAFERQFAGRMETGASSISDPAMGIGA